LSGGADHGSAGPAISCFNASSKFLIYHKHRHSGFPAIDGGKKWLKTGMFRLCDETEICNTKSPENS